MNTRSRFKKFGTLVAIAAVSIATLSACTSVPTPSGMCGFLVGSGQNGNDAKIHQVIYPDENVQFDTTDEVAHYVPCGPRNYIINDGSVEGLGDRFTPVEAYTSTNTPVLVQIDALWQLNQGQDALLQFAELCNKYTCYTTEAIAGDSNFATDGWNGMLRENFSPAIDDAVQTAMAQVGDDIWRIQSQEAKEQLAALVSDAFMDAIRVRTGYTQDLFCGSGNSGWSDPATPGQDGNEYTCTQVRFDVTAVEARDKSTQTNATAQNQLALDTAANQARYDKSLPLYGDQTNYWLGIQDAASKCREGSTCNFYMGTPQQ